MSCPGDGRWVHMREKPVRLPFLGTSLFNTSSRQTSWILCPWCMWLHRAAGGGWAACGHSAAGGNRAGCSLARPCWGTASLSHLAPVCWADLMAESRIKDRANLLFDLRVMERWMVPQCCCWDNEEQQNLVSWWCLGVSSRTLWLENLCQISRCFSFSTLI